MVDLGKWLDGKYVTPDDSGKDSPDAQKED